MGLGAPDIERLGKLLGMLGSDHDGERASAALMANKLVLEQGMTWPEILEPLKAACAAARSPLPHRRDALACLGHPHLWSEKEAEFLANMSRRFRPPTPAQAQWLADLLGRAQAEDIQ